MANAVLALCRGSMYDRARASLLARCCNGAGAGFGGTAREAENMEAVIDFLKREGVSVVVVSADSVVSGDEGLCGTYWVLGEQGAPRLGVFYGPESMSMYCVATRSRRGAERALSLPLGIK